MVVTGTAWVSCLSPWQAAGTLGMAHPLQEPPRAKGRRLGILPCSLQSEVDSVGLQPP